MKTKNIYFVACDKYNHYVSDEFTVKDELKFYKEINNHKNDINSKNEHDKEEYSEEENEEYTEHYEETYECEKEESHNEPIYIMTIELQEGTSNEIKIFSDSNPNELAYDFCKKNDLDFKSLSFLANELDKLIKIYSNMNNNQINEEEAEAEQSLENNNNIELKYNKDKIKESEERLNLTRKNKLEFHFDEKEEYRDNNLNEINLNMGPIITHEIQITQLTHLIDNKNENSFFTQSDNNTKGGLQYMVDINNTKNKTQNTENIIFEDEYKVEQPISQIYMKEIEQSEKNNFNEVNDLKNQYISEGIFSDKPNVNNPNQALPYNKESEINKEKLKKNQFNTDYYLSIQNNLQIITSDERRSNQFSYSISSLAKSSFNFYIIPSKYEKQIGTENIYQRLPRDAERRAKAQNTKLLKYNLINNFQASTIGLKPSCNKNSQFNEGNINYGELLYKRGKVSKEEKLRILANIKSEIDQKFAKNYTFKPLINDNHQIECNFNRLSSCNKDSNRPKENTSRMNNKQDVNCRYLEYPKESIRRSSSRSSYCQKSYDVEIAADRKFQKIEKLRKEINSQFTYAPQINKKYQINIGFDERQEIFKENLIKQRESAIEEKKIQKDENGNTFFKPQLISKSKFYKRNIFRLNGNNDVFTHNYEYANRYKQKKENLIHKYSTIECTKINNDSDAIYNKFKEDAFKKLFKELDSYKDDLISVYNLGTKNVSKEILRIINPIINELRQEKKTLNEYQFLRAMSNLFENTKYEDRKLLISHYKEKKRNTIESFNFKPKINKNSIKLAHKHYQKLSKSLSINYMREGNKVNESSFYFKISNNDNTSSLDKIKSDSFNNFKRSLY